MKWKVLLELSKDETLENLRRNQLVFRIAREAILNYIAEGEVPDEHEFKNAFFIWEREEKTYLLIAQDTDGDIVVNFPDPYNAKIVRDGVHDFQLKPVFDNVSALLKQCIIIINGKAQELETVIVHKYLQDVRYGTEEYLESEFKQFVEHFLDNLGENPGKRVYKHIPLKFNYRGRLQEYLEEYGGQAVNNLHILNKQS